MVDEVNISVTKKFLQFNRNLRLSVYLAMFRFKMNKHCISMLRTID